MVSRVARGIRAHGWSLAAVALLVVAWEVIGRAGVTTFVPPLSDVLAGMPDLYTSTQVSQAIGMSLGSLGLGFGLAVAIGVPLGCLIARSQIAYMIVSPYLTFFLSAPKPALVPALLVVFGLGGAPIVVIVFLYSFFFIVLNTMASVRAVPEELMEMARSFGARRVQMIGKIVVPHATPLALSGVRLGAGRSVKGLILGQQLIAVVGIGGLVQVFGLKFQLDRFYGLMIGITGFALLMMGALRFIETRSVWVRTQAPSTDTRTSGA